MKEKKMRARHTGLLKNQAGREEICGCASRNELGDWLDFKKAKVLPPLRAPNTGMFHGLPSCASKRLKNVEAQSTC